MSLIKSKHRVSLHGEVFTPPWMVEAMLNLVKEESDRIDSRFLEPACGSGNFVVQILRRKLAAVDLKYGRSGPDRQYYALLGLMCIYGIELLADNIAECRTNLLQVFSQFFALAESDELYHAASFVLSLNLVHGDALTMLTQDSRAITFAEWSYLGKGEFLRRDFRYAALTQASAFSVEGTLFANPDKVEVLVPERTFQPVTVSELAAAWQGEAAKEAV